MPSGALLLAVCRGKVSEGLDFKGEKARAVFVVSAQPNVSLCLLCVSSQSVKKNGATSK